MTLERLFLELAFNCHLHARLRRERKFVPSDKLQALDDAVAKIQERFGPTALHKRAWLRENPHISTRFPLLDRALGIGGVPRGRITELTARPTSGLGTLALRLIASAQGQGDHAVYIDSDSTFDGEYAAHTGVDLDRLLVVRPGSLLEGLDITRSFVDGKGIGILVYDLGETHSTQSDNIPILLDGLRTMRVSLEQANCALVFLTRLSRRFIPNRPAVSAAFTYHATLQIHLDRDHWLRRLDDVVGCRSLVTITKNQLAPLSYPVSIPIAFWGTEP